MPPIEVEPVRIGVELDASTYLACLLKHRVEVERVRVAREQETARRMGKYGKPRIVERAQHTLRHRRAVHRKT